METPNPWFVIFSSAGTTGYIQAVGGTFPLLAVALSSSFLQDTYEYLYVLNGELNNLMETASFQEY